MENIRLVRKRFPIGNTYLTQWAFELSEPCAYSVVVLSFLYLPPLASFDYHDNQYADRLLDLEVKEVSSLVLASSVFSVLGVIFIRLIRNLRVRRQPMTACNDNTNIDYGVSFKSKSSRDNDDNNNAPVSLQQIPFVANESRARGVVYIDDRLQNSNSDKLGVAMGSTIGPLLILAVIYHNSVASSNDQTLSLIYLSLLASLGFSLALSTTSLSFLRLLQLRYGHQGSSASTTPITFAIISIFLPFLFCHTWNIIYNYTIRKEVSTSSLPAFIIFICFATLQILFLLHYARGNSNIYTPKSHRNKNKKEHDYGCKSPSPLPFLSSAPPLQQVFTLGEWVTVSSFLSILVTDFFFRYCYRRNYYQYHHNSYNLNGEELSSSSPMALVPPIHDSYIAVMHAGMVGCFFGIVMSLFLRSMLCRLVVRVVEAFSCTSVLKSVKQKKNRVIILWVECCLHSALIIYAILMTVDHALRQCYSFYSSNYDDGENSFHLLNQFTPRSIPWLVAFLFDSNIKHLPPQSTSRRTIMPPPYIWLLYWILILLLTIIIAHRYIIQRYLVNCPHPKERGRRIVVARKFFHLVSIIMFGPPTYAAPEMMGLSYAVAVALLVLVERLRYLVQHHSSFCGGNDLREEKQDGNEDTDCNDIILHSKKVDIVYKRDASVPSVKHHPKSSSYPSSRLNVNDFFHAFFDEKDEGSSDNGFTVTHIALVVGCACPLWINNIIVYPALSQQHNRHFIWLLMPFAGIIVLGVGDAAGAVYGVRWGKTRWPGGSNRTIEGSAAVFFSMVGCSMILHWMDSWQGGGGSYFYDTSASSVLSFLVEALVVWLPLTLIEAATDQIDNICLPLMAVVLISLF